MENIELGIWKLAAGKPEELTPVKCLPHETRTDALASLPECGEPPFDTGAIKFKVTKRGCCIELPLGESEQIYGFGLQLKSFNQRGRKKQIRVNADPAADSGDSHAPVPFFVSTKGYGVLVDTYRYATFYCGSSAKKNTTVNSGKSNAVGGSAEELYTISEDSQDGVILVEIPHAMGADLYFFGGPDMRSAVQRYVLFSGGGCLPPIWGLGVLYRAYAKADSEDVLLLAKGIREDGMPCDMLGLEPGWQSHSYSCSLSWDGERFEKPGELIGALKGMGFHVNLWEHAFLHPTSPLYSDFIDRACDYQVWGGLVPDFLDGKASEMFIEYHRREFFEKGIAGFKLDECDNSDYTGSWSFPECSEFPSGMDGEQMHSAFGMLYQRSVLASSVASGIRTYGQVRSSHALASPMPFVL